jgi:DNA topoisomerase-1
MKKIFWFATGIAAGLAVAKQLRENPEAQAAVNDAAKRARALGEAFTAGYKERAAELKKPVAKKSATAKKPAAKKPAAKKPVAKKTATKPSAK